MSDDDEDFDDGEWEVVAKYQDPATAAMTIMSAGVLNLYTYRIRNKETGRYYTVLAEDADDLGDKIANGEMDEDD